MEGCCEGSQGPSRIVELEIIIITVMVSPLKNAFTFRNARMCLQCAAYQGRGGSNYRRQMMRAFHKHKPTVRESLECVIRETPGSTYHYQDFIICNRSVRTTQTTPLRL
jgi:hypothetical protein